MLSDREMLKTVDRLIKEQPEIFDALLEFERTKRVPKFTYKKRVNFTIDAELFRRFRQYCNKHGIKMSARIEQHILEDVKGAVL